MYYEKTRNKGYLNVSKLINIKSN